MSVFGAMGIIGLMSSIALPTGSHRRVCAMALDYGELVRAFLSAASP